MAEKQDNSPYDVSLVSWQQLPQWMKDNEYILSSYRKVSNSYKLSLATVFRIHNETANIWSHFLGALLFAVSLYHFLSSSWPSLSRASTSDILAVSIYYLGVINCFILSTCFHVFSNHSKEVHKFGNELDHIGVVLVIYGSTLPATYFEFQCQPELRYFYWSLSSAFALASAVFTLRREFRQPAYRRVRFYMYTLLGLSVFFPVLHGLWLHGGKEVSERMSLRYLIGLGVLNFSGAVIYAARVPERWFPETFDVLGASHQIMHVLVVMGALSWEKGLLQCIERRGEDTRARCKI